MIRCFPQSKATLVGGILLTVALAAALGVRLVGNERWVFIVSILLFTMIGTLLTLFVSNLMAMRCNQNVLGLLYIERQPEAFLKAYANVPKGLNAGTMSHASAISYLADGMLADGRAEDALALLDEIDPHGRISLELLVADARIRAQLLHGDLSVAKEGLRRYQQGLARARTENPNLAKNLFARYEALHQELLFRQGKTVNLAKITELEEESNVILRRLELMLLEGEILLTQGETEHGTARLREVISAGGTLHVATRAKELLAQTASV